MNLGGRVSCAGLASTGRSTTSSLQSSLKTKFARSALLDRLMVAARFPTISELSNPVSPRYH